MGCGLLEDEVCGDGEEEGAKGVPLPHALERG